MVGLWYQRKALYAAVVLGLFYLLGAFIDSGAVAFASVLRVTMFLAVGYFIGYLFSSYKADFEERLGDIIDFLPDATFVVDSQGQVIVWNKAIERMTGVKARDILGKGNYEYSLPFYGKRRPILIDLVINQDNIVEKEYLTFEKREKVLVGESFCPGVGQTGAFLFGTASPLYDSSGNIVGAIESIRDVTERKRAEEKIEYLNSHDHITGLFNRTYLEKEMYYVDKDENLPISVIVGDINGLKIINDAFGYQPGDEILKRAADVIKDNSKNGLIARWGGDEFAVILPRTGSKEAHKITERINKFFNVNDIVPVDVSISFAVATKEDKTIDINNLLKQAEDSMYRNKLLENSSTRSSFISSLMNTLGTRSDETEEHTRRIRDRVNLIGKELDLALDELKNLDLLAALHDIGKIAVPDDILKKPGKLTDEEWEIIKKHPETGYKIALSLPELAPVAEGILTHHERWDGTGYPLGLKGDKIPLISRIISIVDAYDVMVNGRPYKKALTHQEALEEIKRCSGTQFDPWLVEKFLNIL